MLSEAYELVEKDLFSADDFRAFTFSNAVELYTGTNRDFFRGTVLEGAVGSHLEATRQAFIS